MPLYRQTHSQRLDFPTLQNPDGSGVTLEPGETVELDAEPDDTGHYPGTVWLEAVDSGTPVTGAMTDPAPWAADLIPPTVLPADPPANQ